MSAIVLYCIGVMYTPGPVNMLSLNRGVHSRVGSHVSFCLGVATAICFLFLLIGYAGSAVIPDAMMPILSSCGAAFILWLAYKIVSSDVGGVVDGEPCGAFRFRDGLLMQLLNPKSFLAVLPVTAVQFPAAGIEGSQIALWSLGLGVLGFGAPLSYAVTGASVSRFLEKPIYLRSFNMVMGAALVFAAAEMAYVHVYLALV